MFKILKVLNNNGILVINLDTKQEFIFLGKGVGFGKKINQNISEIENAKAYRFTEQQQSRQDSIDTIKSISPIFIEIAGGIIEEAEKQFGNVDNHILLPLADHIAFAIKRMEQGIELKNPFAKEIKEKEDIAACHAIGQACAVVHTAGHAIGYPIYDLTSIIYGLGIERCAEAVEKRKQDYIDRLFYWNEHCDDYKNEWAPFMEK